MQYRCTGRTNIDLDDELVAEVMRRYGISTTRAAVDLALRRLVATPLTRDFPVGLRGIGFGSDLDELRGARQPGLQRSNSW